MIAHARMIGRGITGGWIHRLIAVAALLLSMQAFGGDTFVLERVVVQSRNGQLQSKPPEREVRFDIDSETGMVETRQIIVVAFTVSRRGYTRFTLKLDGLRAGAGGDWSTKSFECEEGMLGPEIDTSFCGNYRFGENGLDEGGLGDDIRVGAPFSLDDFSATFNGRLDGGWHLILTSEPPDVSPIRKVHALEFVLRDVPPN